MSTVAAVMPARARRTPADWAGCALFCAFAVTLPLTSGNSGLMLLPAMLYEILVAATFLIRNQPRRTLTGVGPRLAAYGATFLLPVFVWASTRWAPPFMAPSGLLILRAGGACVWLFGAVLAFWPVWCLRRSFSIEPAARELNMVGPYSFARHPIYATQILMYLGMWMLHATIPFAVALAAWLVVLRIRAGYEEGVLRAEYPEYDEYRQRVGAFGPRLWNMQPARGG